MILFSSPASPFGRKIKLALYATCMQNNVDVRVGDTGDPESEFKKLNPLGKLPTLSVNGMPLYDSRVIMEFIDSEAGEKSPLFPASGPKRFSVLTKVALADGAMDAAILMVYEGRFRTAEQRVESFVDYQRSKVERALVALAKQTGSYQNGATPNAAEISLACLLDYLDLRALVEWREFAPSLEAWITDFAAHAAGYQATLAPDMPPAPWRNAR
ncbi:glutathione S-transferase N-terminal domain-containing protein [Alphaproteobacteria bacterium]|nr:glutathione S-transferase N-terminal domain-containing protein [Alphaproteobacteria bacterium]